MGPETLHPRQPLESPTPNGDKGARGTRRRGVPRVTASPSLACGDKEVKSPVGVRTCRPPTQGPARHSPVRSPQRGGAQGAGSLGALHASGPTPTSPRYVVRGSWGASPDRGRCLAATEALLALPARRAGTTASQSTRQGGPHLPSVCGVPAAAAAAKADDTVARAAATATARIGARRGLMLSSASSPPLWAPRAAKIFHILAPSPRSLSRPPARGFRPHPLRRHVTERGGGRGEAFPAGQAARAPKQLATPCFARVLSPPSRLRTPEGGRGMRAHCRLSHACDVPRRGLLDRSYWALPDLERLHNGAPYSGLRTPRPL